MPVKTRPKPIKKQNRDALSVTLWFLSTLLALTQENEWDHEISTGPSKISRI